jgi:hypothetical protein
VTLGSGSMRRWCNNEQNGVWPMSQAAEDQVASGLGVALMQARTDLKLRVRRDSHVGPGNLNFI